MFNGIDRLQFPSSWQLSVTQPMSSPISANGEKKVAQEGDSSACILSGPFLSMSYQADQGY